MMNRVFMLLFAALVWISAVAIAEQTVTGTVAGTEDMTDVLDIVDSSLQPVTGDMLIDGTYEISIDVSSSMFKVVDCTLTVENGSMTARLYMKSDAYSYLYPGPAETAAKADAEELIPLSTQEGGYTFTLPVDAINVGTVCAAYSARKQMWYPRTILLRADSLPSEAWHPEFVVTSESLGLEDGPYTCAVSLTGKGRTGLASPAAISIQEGRVTADIVFSTFKIDYVIVNGEKLEPTSTEDGAAFTVPVAGFDIPLQITVDSTAIKPAVEVQYTMTFDSSTLEPIK